ncbi:MAG TPA: OsmC family protein [Caulobacteraceae bacterium]|nr:OsmC family protein [Caulobacteraceae bacterium]
MSTYRASVDWKLAGDFAKHRYSRVHTIVFDEGLTVPGTSGPQIVNPRYGRPDAMDPEQAFVAALAACHMLWFLDVAARAGFVAESYRDAAEGVLERGPEGKEMMTRVVLRPKVGFSGERQPSAAELARLHHDAHEACFIANSVKSEVVIEPVS